MKKIKNLIAKINWKQFRVTIVIICLAFLLGIKLGQLLLNKCETRQEFLLGTFVEVKLWGSDRKKLATNAEKIVTEIRNCEGKFSTSVKSSDISKINDNAGSFVAVSGETYDLLEQALYYSRLTNGAFDPTVGVFTNLWQIGSDRARVPREIEINSAKKFVGFKNVKLKKENGHFFAYVPRNFRLDLGAIAKGYITDKIRSLVLPGTEALLDLGGNICVIGNKPIKIGLQKPWAKRGEIFKKISAKNTCVVTSGAYERYFKKDGKLYHHIIDPATGAPSESDLESVTIITPNATMADALSTALFVMGRQKAEKFIKEFGAQLGFEAILKTKGNTEDEK